MNQFPLVEKAYRDTELSTEWREHIIELSAAHEALVDTLRALLEISGEAHIELTSVKAVRNMGKFLSACKVANSIENGNRYLLKQPLKQVSEIFPDGQHGDLGLLFAEELTDCIGGIAANDEPFLLWSGLCLLLGLLRHCVLLSLRLLSRVLLVPVAGVGPAHPEWALGCKPSLSASSSTRALEESLEAVVGRPVKTSPTTAWFLRPSSAALSLSSFFVLSRVAYTSGSIGPKHTNHRGDYIAVSFGEVCRILNESACHAGNRHALETLRNLRLCRRRRRVRSIASLRSNLGAAILGRRGARRLRLLLGDVRRQRRQAMRAMEDGYDLQLLKELAVDRSWQPTI